MSVALYIRPPRINGKREPYRLADLKKPEEGTYTLRCDVDGKRWWMTIGRDCLMRARAQQKEYEARELRGELVPPQPKKKAAKPELKPKPQKRAMLVDMKEHFIARKRLQRHEDGTPLDGETITAYGQHVDELLTACTKSGHRYVDELDGDDLRQMIEALHADDYAHNTICNHYTSIVAFVRFCKLDHKDEDRFLPRGERPRPRVGPPESYTQEEIDSFLAACDDERHALAYEFLYKTGARELEMVFLEWPDLQGNGGSPTVTFTKHGDHDTKTRKSRTVPLERGLAKKLEAWRARNPRTKLVFGTEADKPDWHFWRYCKATAKKAGFDPSDWWLHKFRDTFATEALRKRPDMLRDVQVWMGHADITMTQRYLAPGTGKMQQVGINDIFGGTVQQEMAVASVSRKGLSITPQTRTVAVTGTPAF